MYKITSKSEVLQELIDALINFGAIEVLNEVATHGEYPSKKDIKDSYDNVTKSLNKVEEVLFSLEK